LLLGAVVLLVTQTRITRRKLQDLDEAHHVMNGMFLADLMADRPLDRLTRCLFDYYRQYPALGFGRTIMSLRRSFSLRLLSYLAPRLAASPGWRYRLRELANADAFAPLAAVLADRGPAAYAPWRRPATRPTW